MKDRFCHWPSTLMGLGILAFAGLMIWRHPLLLDKPELLLAVMAGLYGIVTKGSK